MFDWNDLKFVLAVARNGSTLAASRTLRVSQTTVARRVDALESSLGVRLFERRPGGYLLTANGEKLIVHAEQVEKDAAAVANAVQSWNRAVAGTLRVTTTELLAMDILAPLISELRSTHPSLQIEMVADDRRLDLARGEVDVAIRLGALPAEAGITCRRLGRSAWSLHCAKSYAERHGVPQTVEDLDDHEIVGGGGELAKLAPLVRLRELAPKATVAIRCNSVPNLIAAVRSGAGIGPLPAWAAYDNEAVINCPIPELQSSSDIWLLYRKSQKDVPHMRIFLDAVTARFAFVRHRLEGSGSARQP